MLALPASLMSCRSMLPRHFKSMLGLYCPIKAASGLRRTAKTLLERDCHCSRAVLRLVRSSAWCGKPNLQAPRVYMPQYGECLCTSSPANFCITERPLRSQPCGEVVQMYLSQICSAVRGWKEARASSSDRSTSAISSLAFCSGCWNVTP